MDGREGTPRKDWRQFERLVSKIERWLAPEGARVQSPDRIPDKMGFRREVDVSVRMQVGSTPVLIIMECRDRARPQGVGWIEQLATKGEALGASRVVAVTSSDFSAPAKEAARRLGVELRRVEEITEEVVKRWGWYVEITCDSVGFRVVSAHLITSPRLRSWEPPSEWRDAYYRDPLRTPIGVDQQTGAPVNVEHFGRIATKNGRHLLEDTRGCAEPVRRDFEMGMMPERYMIHSAAGPLALLIVRLTLDVWWEKTKAPPARLFVYHAPGGEILEMARTMMPLADGLYLEVDYADRPPTVV